MTISCEQRDLADRSDVEVFVRAFYREVAMDGLLGPVFEHAHVDWPAHIDRLTDFWVWQLFGERGYEGNPLRAHEPLHAATPFTGEHFDRWIELFETTMDERFAGPVATAAVVRAHKMAHALRRLLDGVSAPGGVGVQPTFVAPVVSRQ